MGKKKLSAEDACFFINSQLTLCGPRLGTSLRPDAVEAGRGVRYSSPPPPYPPLCGARARELGIAHNLMESFVAMDDVMPNPAAEEEEDVPVAATITGVGAPIDAGAGMRARSANNAVRYGQVMDVGSFVRWLSGVGSTDASVPTRGSQASKAGVQD